MKSHYDVLIVGSGASGGTVAYTLARKGISCVMLDAGPVMNYTRDRALKKVYELPYHGFGKPGRFPHVTQANESMAIYGRTKRRIHTHTIRTIRTTGCEFGW